MRGRAPSLIGLGPVGLAQAARAIRPPSAPQAVSVIGGAPGLIVGRPALGTMPVNQVRPGGCLLLTPVHTGHSVHAFHGLPPARLAVGYLTLTAESYALPGVDGWKGPCGVPS